MKEEIRQLYKEYYELCMDTLDDDARGYIELTQKGFINWLITGELSK